MPNYVLMCDAKGEGQFNNTGQRVTLAAMPLHNDTRLHYFIDIKYICKVCKCQNKQSVNEKSVN